MSNFDLSGHMGKRRLSPYSGSCSNPYRMISNLSAFKEYLGHQKDWPGHGDD